MKRISRATCERAFTLVELVAAGAVLSLLASLLLPAVLAAREAARAAQCRSNLHQIGVELCARDVNDRNYRFPDTFEEAEFPFVSPTTCPSALNDDGSHSSYAFAYPRDWPRQLPERLDRSACDIAVVEDPWPGHVSVRFSLYLDWHVGVAPTE